MSEEEPSVLERNKQKIYKEYLKPLQDNKLLENRLHDEKSKRKRLDGEFQRDYTRILYSSAFRRLQGKMQLFEVQSDQFIRNRLTHSLEVAQIARSIATEVGYSNDVYVVEACALAHDMGNPPFGHAGERYLNKICKKNGLRGFEGNAQTFRILTTVEQKRSDFQGLNLTYRTLLGVLKYYNKYDENGSDKQKFIYDDVYQFVQNIVNKTGVSLRTLDVQIVDLADEIAYAAHDLEDGLRTGSFTAEDILHDFYAEVTDKECANKLEEIFENSKIRAGFKSDKISSSEFNKLYQKEISSCIINTLINDIGIVELLDEERKKRGTDAKQEIGFVHYKELAAGLKKVIYKCATRRDGVNFYEDNGNAMLSWLYNFYLAHVEYLPPEYRYDTIVKQFYDEDAGNIPSKDYQNRLIIDYLSGMMDEYVKTTYNHLQGLLKEQ